MKSSLASNLLRSFKDAASPKTQKSNQRKKPKKRRPPLSVRLTDDQWDRLGKDAGGKPLSAYAKERIFRASPSNAGKIQDAESLARILATLGRTELFYNLGTLVQMVEAGDVTLSSDQEEQISIACAAVLLMRNDLIEALGLKAE